jgi:hypothetical protein
MESMLQFIKKLATNRVSHHNSDAANQSNDDLIEAINVFADRLRGDTDTPLEEIITPDFIPKSKKKQMNKTGPVNQATYEDHYMTDGSPVQKIIKKRYKIASKSRKYKIEKPPSPLNKEQMKLLHDPHSFEKYAQDLDIKALRSLQENKNKK